MRQSYLIIGIILSVAGLFLTIYEYIHQTIDTQLEQERLCNIPGSSCPFISYNFQDGLTVIGFSVLATGIILVMIYYSRAISAVKIVCRVGSQLQTKAQKKHSNTRCRGHGSNHSRFGCRSIFCPTFCYSIRSTIFQSCKFKTATASVDSQDGECTSICAQFRFRPKDHNCENWRE